VKVPTPNFAPSNPGYDPTAASSPLALFRAALYQRLGVEHHLATDFAHSVRRARDFFGISSATVTMTVTVSPIFTGARKLSVCAR
jgi:hypothetical protein